MRMFEDGSDSKNKNSDFFEKLANNDDFAKAVVSPVWFSRLILDIEPRWYQKIILKDDSNKKVIRAGRRIGKTYTMILKILYSIYTNEDFRVMVVGPLGIQVDTIFEELRTIINNNDFLRSSVERSVKSPQRIKLKNGSSVLGLSAGTSSGSGGKSIRGQAANLIVLDECDFLSDEDLNSIMGMSLQDMGNIEIWAASTPSGAREMFYDWCNNAELTYGINNIEEKKPVKRVKNSNSNNWHQFHFPSHVHPNWDSDMEAELQSMFTEIGYIHEVEAKFGDTEAGVYKNKYIDQSIFDYKYEDMKGRKPQPGNIRIIGVDWDRLVPTQIVVSEFNKKTERIQLVDRYEIEPSEFTFDRAVKKIIDLNNFYNPEHIYVDRGFGEYQAEVLKKKLGNKVKGIHFKENIEVVDPVDKSVDKKETKHFMVTQTSILLERNQLMFSEDDQDFLDQLRNYRIVKYTSAGKPVFNDDNEHAHDAFALTVLAFNQEYPDLAKLLEKSRMAQTMGFVNKRLSNKNEDDIFDLEFNSNQYGMTREQQDELSDEPDYVKHMKSIQFARKRGGSLRKKSSLGRGGSSKSSGRGSF